MSKYHAFLRTSLQLLSGLQVDDSPVGFDYGVLLQDDEAGRDPGGWHILAMRVSPRLAELAPGEPHEVRVTTRHGETLHGCARAAQVASAPSCLRLIGTSKLEPAL
jgi:hypothetical protein